MRGMWSVGAMALFLVAGIGSGTASAATRGDCPAGYEQSGLICYEPCKAGYSGVGPVCWQKCPSGFADHGAFCGKPAPYGRGAGYPWKFGDGLNLDGAKGRCERDHGKGKCEQSGLIIYPKCKVGFHAVGCCICSPNCVDGIAANDTENSSCSRGRVLLATMVAVPLVSVKNDLGPTGERPLDV